MNMRLGGNTTRAVKTADTLAPDWLETPAAWDSSHGD